MAILKYTDTNGNIVAVNSYKINNVIVSQDKGQSTADVMSQKAVTDEISELESTIATKAISSDVYTKSETDSKLSEKANTSDVYSKAESDGKFLTEHQDISNLATKADVENVKINVTTNTSEISNVKTELGNKISTLQTDNISINEKLNKKIEKVEIEKNSSNDLQYYLKVDDVVKGEINIPKDQFLKEVNYDEISKTLRFVFVTKTGEQTTTVNIGDLVDTYEAGNGLSLNGNLFRVKIAVGSEDYLSVTEDGIMLKGIDASIAKKANVSDVYTKAEIEAKGYLTQHQSLNNYYNKTESDGKYQPKGNYLTSHQSLTDYAKKTEVANADTALQNDIDANEAAVTAALNKLKQSAGFDINGNYNNSDYTSLADAIDDIVSRLGNIETDGVIDCGEYEV